MLLTSGAMTRKMNFSINFESKKMQKFGTSKISKTLSLFLTDLPQPAALNPLDLINYEKPSPTGRLH